MKRTVELSVDLGPLFGPMDKNLLLLEKSLGLNIVAVPGGVQVEGTPKKVRRAITILLDYEKFVFTGVDLDDYDFAAIIAAAVKDPSVPFANYLSAKNKPKIGVTCRAKAKNSSQQAYMDSIGTHDLVFGIGPAGTGKTYLAVAMAITALLKKEVRQIVLVRPVIEAGEKLGFLPGTFQEKIDPYMRPLFDALGDMLSPDAVKKMIEKGTIEVAALAYMRGRTIKNAFIIADEAQNTTTEQMKMLVTRLGEGSKMVVNGDPTQIDLPKHMTSGLADAEVTLRGVDGIDFHEFKGTDVVRHALVQRIVDAYDNR